MKTSACKCPLMNGDCTDDCMLSMDDGQCAIVRLAQAQETIADALSVLPDISRDLYSIRMDMPGK